MASVFVFLWATWLLGAPALDDTAQVQLDAVYDDSAGLDRSGLYALLKNAMQWDAGDETGAVVPDYAQLAHSPQPFRGEVMLIEGKFLRKRRLTLAKPGPWGEAITEWAVQVGPGEADHDFALVYFVDPDQTMTRPGRDAQVRIAARFYMVWQTLDMENQPRRYLTFVGRPVRLLTEGASNLKGPMLMVALAAGASGLFLLGRLIRRGIRPAPLPRQQHKTTCSQSASALPDDPADALAQLHDQARDQ